MPAAWLLQTFLNLALIATAAEVWRRPKRCPALALTICVVLGLCLLLQLACPAILGATERDTMYVLSGQWWRIGSALFFQDGGLSGGLSNIVLLLVVGGLAEQILARGTWLVTYFGGGLATEIVALSWQPVGAGNSVATCALAGFLVVVLPVESRRWPLLIMRVGAGVSAAILLWQRDIHGIGAMAGAVLAVFAARIQYAMMFGERFKDNPERSRRTTKP